VFLAGIIGGARAASGAGPELAVPRIAGEVRVDGSLSGACYAAHPPLADFTVAGEPGRRAQPTRAWLFWRPEELIFAFSAVDSQIVAAPESGHGLDVSAQDRVELFLWSGNPDDTYYCIEIGARGAVHAYAARFYRKFDESWSPRGMKVAVIPTASGYQVEGSLPREVMESCGFRLEAGRKIRCGLFRADFQPGRPNDPTWICWVDSRGPRPDFHVAASFGTITLGGGD